MEAAGGSGDCRLGLGEGVPGSGADNEQTSLAVDIAKSSRQGPNKQFLGDDSPVTGLVSQASADLRRTTVLFSTGDLPQVLDVLPGVSLVRPPFVPVDAPSVVEVLFDCATVLPDAFVLVGMAGSVEIVRQQVPRDLAQPMRFTITPVGIGIVDFFTSGHDLQGNAAAGLPGHLCVLPELAARDGNRIYDMVVEAAGKDGRLFDEYAGVRDGGIGQHSRLKAEMSNSSGQQEHFGQTPQSYGLSPSSKGQSGSALNVSQQSREAKPEDNKAQQTDRPHPSVNVLTNCWADLFISNLEVQKWAWKENLMQFVLELEVVLQSLKPPTDTVPGSSQSTVVGIVQGPALILVLENMLHHLRLFHAWELMAFVLSRVVDGGICVFWEKELLPHKALTAASLKEKYRQQEKDCGLDAPGDSSDEDFPMGTATSSIALHADDIFVTAPTIESVHSGQDERSEMLGQAAAEARAGRRFSDGEEGVSETENVQIEARPGQLEVPGVPALGHYNDERKELCIDSVKDVGEGNVSAAGDHKAAKKPLLSNFWHKLHKRFKIHRNSNQQPDKQQGKDSGLWPDLSIGHPNNSMGSVEDSTSSSACQEPEGTPSADVSTPSPVPESEPTSRSPVSSASPNSSRDFTKKLKKHFAGDSSVRAGDGIKQQRLKSMFGGLKKAFSKSSKQLVREDNTEPRS